MTSASSQIRYWLCQMPGAVWGVDPMDCLTKAHAQSGLPVSLGDFTDILHAHGFRPDILGSQYVLRLPEKCVNFAGNAGALARVRSES